MSLIHKIYHDDVFEVRHMADQEHDGLDLLGLLLAAQDAFEIAFGAFLND